MLHETIKIELPYGELGLDGEGTATMTTYIKDIFPKDQDPFKRPLIVICPGGGYNHYSPREGESIAVKMLDMGYNTVVFRYSLMPMIYPAQLYEAAYVMKYVRDHAAEWDVDTDKIIIGGFSAGAHVAGLMGTGWNSERLDYLLANVLKCSHEYVKPNGMLLGYPVVTSGAFAHKASFERVLGDNFDKYIEEVSVEKRVDIDTPPAFIWHTFADNSVPLENSLLLAQALRDKGIEFDYHVYAKGEHGLGLGTKETATKNMGHYEPQVATWTEAFKNWMGVMYE